MSCLSGSYVEFTSNSQPPNPIRSFIMADQMQNGRRVLKDADAIKGRFYAHHHNFAAGFCDDDAKTDKDSKNFQRLLKLLGLPRAKEGCPG